MNNSLRGYDLHNNHRSGCWLKMTGQVLAGLPEGLVTPPADTQTSVSEAALRCREAECARTSA